MTRGYFAIGVYEPKSAENIGTLWRSAYCYGAALVFTIGRRYQKQASDTPKTWRHIPLMHFDTLDAFHAAMPHDSALVCVELHAEAVPLAWFRHPDRGIYLLGSEDGGLPPDVLAGQMVVQIQSPQPYSLNVATAGSIVMYDRYVRSRRET